MKSLVLLFSLVILIQLSFLYATCSEDQIDINSASAEELDELYGIGEVKAKAIIDTRPFETIDDLINVNGIGEVTLENIKDQGLACVEEEELAEEPKEEDQIVEEEINENETDDDDSEDEDKEGFEDDNKNEVNNEQEVLRNNSKINGNIELIAQPIKLTPLSEENAKDIKTGQNSEFEGKVKIAIYGLVLFSVLLAFLFFVNMKKNRYNKNEFE